MSHPKKEYAIAIAGLGTVGGGVYELLRNPYHHELIEARSGERVSLHAVSDLNDKLAKPLPPHCRFVPDALQLADDDAIDIVIELIGGTDGIADELVTRCLGNGKHVITANKALLAQKGATLFALANKNNCQLAFEAAVGGGIPVIKVLREGMMVNHITRMTGILNGTCNYILTQMARQNRAFSDALHDAQQLGYAEADPSTDIHGHDAAHKLTILAAMAWGEAGWDTSFPVGGIDHITTEDFHYASQWGFVIRHLADGVWHGGRVIRHVEAMLLDKNHDLAHVHDVTNGVLLHSEPLGPLLLTGHGAGRAATAAAVISDLTDLMRENNSLPIVNDGYDKKTESHNPLSRAFYIRLEVEDRAGVLAHISEQCAREGVSLNHIIQDTPQGKHTQLVMTTHPVQQDIIEILQKTWQKQGDILTSPQIIPIFQ